MSYQMEIGSGVFRMPGKFFTDRLTETYSHIREDGFSMELRDIASPNVHLIWGNHTAASARTLSVQFETQAVITHFNLARHTLASRSGKAPGNGFSLYHLEAKVYQHDIVASAKEQQDYAFFELALSPAFFERFQGAESSFLRSFCEEKYGKSNGQAPVHYRSITPAMMVQIREMAGNGYKGYLKDLYLEAKAVELFLLQLKELDQEGVVKACKLKPGDIACLQEAKRYIEQNLDAPCSIIDLARKVGINQMKLKSGFKELFGTTVFGYLRDRQMEQAKQWLLEEKLMIAEVADRLGYVHAHHFAAAFKRKFGVPPGQWKS